MVRRDENGAIGMRQGRKGKDDSADCCCAAVLSDGDASAATNDEVASAATTDKVASAAMANNWVASAATGGSMAG